MSGELMNPETAGKVLERVIFDRVLEAIDFEVIDALERDLWLSLGESGLSDLEASQLARQMVKQAFVRLADDLRTQLGAGPGFSDCALCDVELEIEAAAREGRVPRLPKSRRSPVADS